MAVLTSLAVAKANYKNAVMTVEAVKLVTTKEGAKALELYRNLLYYEARQP